eukprot:6544395-Prymnesium_polylepis.1
MPPGSCSPALLPRDRTTTKPGWWHRIESAQVAAVSQRLRRPCEYQSLCEPRATSAAAGCPSARRRRACGCQEVCHLPRPRPRKLCAQISPQLHRAPLRPPRARVIEG